MKVYVTKIAVRGVSPMVWRRLRIAANTSLAALHFIIQIIQGWGDDHPHSLSRPTANKGKVKLADFTGPARHSLVFMAGSSWGQDA